MHPKSEKVWYFAYGSNMSKDKFTGRRGIEPLASARVYLPNWVLSMEIPGVPYSEPSYGSIHPRQVSKAERGSEPDVVGVAYLITAEQYREVIASEGGQIAYTDVSVVGRPIDQQDEEKTGPEVAMRTLASTTMVRYPPPTPSSRYMELISIGAKEAELPPNYLDYLANIQRYVPPTNRWTKVGAFIFLALTQPVWMLLDRLTHSNTGEDGNVPAHVVWIVRTAIFTIWLLHDVVFAPMFGRGDGLGQEEPIMLQADEARHSLLCSEK